MAPYGNTALAQSFLFATCERGNLKRWVSSPESIFSDSGPGIPESHVALARWEFAMKRGSWGSSSELRASFPKAKALGGGRMRFEINGGNYRLIAAFDFDRQAVFIKFIGTHADYDKIDSTTISQF